MASRKTRDLNAEDRALWRSVTETVSPLRKTVKSGKSTVVPPDEPGTKPAAPAKAVSPAPRSRAPAVAKPPPPPPVPTLSPIDRKLTRRIARGSRSVDAKIDLHGLNQREAHARLLSFLQTARARGHRLVLVVTGKGKSEGAAEWWEEGTRGVLRRTVPEWLATPPFRAMVVGYERAHARKGGDGALYVQLRRADKPGAGER